MALGKRLTFFFFFKFRDNIIYSGTAGQIIKIRDCLGQSGTYGMYAVSQCVLLIYMCTFVVTLVWFYFVAVQSFSQKSYVTQNYIEQEK